MPTILAATIVTDVAKDLQDTGNAFWSKSELLGWLNAGQRETVILKPNANTKIAAVQLTPASAQQSIPADGYAFMRLIRNRGAAGTSNGKFIREIDGDALDRFDLTWRSTTNAGAEVDGYFYKPDAPRVFYVQPIAPASALYVEMEYSAAPTDATINGVDGGGSDSVIGIDDAYARALHEYVMYRAYAKDAEHAVHQALATDHYKSFLGLIQAKAQGE